MKTRLVFVRHGESLGNIESRFYGHYDGPLTEKGRMQAEMAAEFLKDMHFDAAYASDLQRAYETGKRIIGRHEGVELKAEPGLREIRAGQWENVPFAVLAEEYKDEYRVWMTDLYNARPVGGESIVELAERVNDAVWKIARENVGGVVLIATHATPIRSLQCRWTGVGVERIQEVKWVQNASVSIVDYDTENMTTELIVLGDASFQGNMATAIPTDV